VGGLDQDGIMNATFQPAPTAIDAESAWTQVLARDPQAAFFYAVTTTGVFCRPACTSRRPLRENVRFFLTPAQAEAAGFRACRRCKPFRGRATSPIDQIRKHLEANLDRRVRLEELGRIAGVSPFTAQRIFKQAMGASPSQYQRALRAGTLRNELRSGASVTSAIYNAGFNSSSRAYEGDPLGMPPARFAAGGSGERIGYGTGETPFGWMIVGGTARGLCWLALAESEAAAEQTLRDEFPAADVEREASLDELVQSALASVREGRDLSDALTAGQPLDLRGTVFQLRVWQALRQIPRGETRSYSQLAAELGDRNATRAVARACATNRVAILVPCHRVVGASGSLTGYRWGVERKRRLLEAEEVRRS
jgi:AraC family transcriptional regulator, regulatory protein of adaptative response / methylated-DNA-[protein]-cysteine methyltransferase